jgi:small-conductance mechanosensitive channel
MNPLADLFDHEALGNDLGVWATAAAIVGGVVLLAWPLRGLVRRRCRALHERHPRSLASGLWELLADTRWWFFVAMGLLAARAVLELPESASVWYGRVLVALVLLQVGVWAGVLVRKGVERRFDAEKDPSRRTGATVVKLMGLLVVWVLVLLSILANVGVDVTALVAGLGVGGIAVALALQNVLGDLFASVSILLDKPFVVGDFIGVGDFVGNVQAIGLKTTRVRSLGGEEIVFANNDLLQSRLRNFKRMQERRIVFQFGVTYDTPVPKLERIPQMVREIVHPLEGVRLDRAHLAKFGDSSLDFEVVYFVEVPDYNTYMDHQEAINLGLLRRFTQEKIEFAFPTRTILAPGLEERWRKSA